MVTLPMISIKSEVLHLALGVQTVRSARRKLLAFGVTIIDGEYVSMEQWQELVEKKIKQNTAADYESSMDLVKGSSFEDFK